MSGRPYSSREEQEAQQMYAAAETSRTLEQVPRPIRAALAHTLYAAALELSNGRVLPVEVRRAAMHVLKAIQETATGRKLP